jgi:hypothetical protein
MSYRKCAEMRWVAACAGRLLLCSWLVCGAMAGGAETVSLEQGFERPPMSARVRAYWWWLNGNVTQAAITRDLEQMRAQGFGGALICDAGGAQQDGNGVVPHGPTFMTPEWRALYRHALREANRLGLEMSLNIQSGWNLGGPVVSADDAAKKLTWSETRVSGPIHFKAALKPPAKKEDYYRDLFVVAYPARTNSPRKSLRNWEQKAVYRTLPSSAPSTEILLEEGPSQPGEEETRVTEVRDLSSKLDAEGVLEWDAPAGDWVVFRFGCTIADQAFVSTYSEGWQGYALDVLDAGAFGRYWDQVVTPLIDDAGKLAGTTLRYLHTDSWEVEAINWTPTLPQEFRERRGYALTPFLPVLAGVIVNSRSESTRFLNDFRKTLGDLAIDNHYAPFRERAHRRGLLIHPESGGPHAVPIDAQRCLGMDDMPMSEFWATSWRHRVGDANRFFVKQPASAAHTYGHRLVAAEGFTTIGPHWQERLWENLKPAFDKACCEGLNRLVWHAFVCSPAEMGMPGQQYFAGTHLNPNSTWWTRSGPFFDYLNRCQFMLQQGLPVADALYYYGDQVPNFAQLKSSDPARVLPGYDYDVVTEEVILTRLAVQKGRLVLPDGMSYRLLVLPRRSAISLPVLRKLKELVAAGATVLGPKPAQSTTLEDFPRSDREVQRLGNELWDNPTAQGRVLSSGTAREMLLGDGEPPDFENSSAPLDYVHRRTADAEIYFVASRTDRVETAGCTFRVADRVPELWDPVTGKRRVASGYTLGQGRVKVPLEFGPYGSWFVVFRKRAAAGMAGLPVEKTGFQEGTGRSPAAMELAGPWRVHFDPRWGGPDSVEFESLASWTERPEPGIKFYSGTASYSIAFDRPERVAKGERLVLDLGEVRELAEVELNGRRQGIVWCPPFQVDITDAVKARGNRLRIEVVNFWPNRIIGDDALPVEQRLTRTNIRKLTRETALMPSGLLGPVRIIGASR